MDKAQQAQAVLLLSLASSVISKRRQIEQACMWPPEYGGDELLLRRIKQFLASPGMEAEAQASLEYFKQFEKGK